MKPNSLGSLDIIADPERLSAPDCPTRYTYSGIGLYQPAFSRGANPGVFRCYRCCDVPRQWGVCEDVSTMGFGRTSGPRSGCGISTIDSVRAQSADREG